MGSLLGLAFLLGITIAGMTLIVAGLFPKVVNFAKQAFQGSLKGFVIALIAWITINGIMNIVGYNSPAGGKWWEHECAGGSSSGGGGNQKSDGKCDPKNKKLESIKIQ